MAVTVLTSEEAHAWCHQRGVRTSKRQPDFSGRGLRDIYFSIPDDPLSRVGLVDELYRHARSTSTHVLVWTTEWGVWPSCEHMPLFMRLREALGDRRGLHEANAHLIDEASSDDGLSIAIVNCLFLWDCWIVADTGEYAAFLCHDEVGDAYATNDTVATELSQSLTELKLLRTL